MGGGASPAEASLSSRQAGSTVGSWRARGETSGPGKGVRESDKALDLDVHGQGWISEARSLSAEAGLDSWASVRPEPNSFAQLLLSFSLLTEAFSRHTAELSRSNGPSCGRHGQLFGALLHLVKGTGSSRQPEERGAAGSQGCDGVGGGWGREASRKVV